MTQQEFLLIAQQYPRIINVWVTEAPSPYHILGLTVPVYDKTSTYVLQFLQQVTSFIVPISSAEVVQLEVTSRSIQNSGTDIFYFFTVQVLGIMGAGNTTVNDANVIFLPGLEAQLFTKSPYNVTQGSVEDQRQSEYIYQEGTPTLAYIQDSLYSSTGWINGRYEGSKTDKLGYKTIEPALAGNTFVGAYYNYSTTDNQIASQSAADRVDNSYFHTGKEPLPEYRVNYANSYLYTVIYPTTTFATIDIGVYGEPPEGIMPLSIGSLVRIGSDVSLASEIFKITSIASTNTIGRYVISFIRGWNKSPIDTNDYAAHTGIQLITPVRVFQLQGSRVQGVSQGKIRLKETSEIIHVDPLGFVVSGSSL